MSTNKWEQITTEEIGTWGQPGQTGGTTTATLSRRYYPERDDCWRWKCIVSAEWGSNQGYHQVHGSWETEGRGNNPAQAIEECRKDVFAHATNEIERAELATMLRKLLYTAEDEEETEEEETEEEETEEEETEEETE